MKRPSRRAGILLIVVLAAAAAGAAAVDLLGSAQADLRVFDPAVVARLEADMWRSYYERHEVRLFLQLGELLRNQYSARFLRAHWMAYRAAKAAFVFKDGKSREDYVRALPDLRSYYAWIRKNSSTSFDVDAAARLELEWWIVHRERHGRPGGDLERSLADLQAAIYSMPAERFMEHGRLRAEAMRIRDEKAEASGVSEQDWERIHQLLLDSWRDLSRTVRPGPAPSQSSAE